MHQQLVPLILRIYRAPTGLWSGRLYEDAEEVGAIGDCASPQDVERAAMEAGYRPDRVETDWHS